MPEGRPATVIAFDFGTRRIGIATGDTVTRTAAPRRAVAFAAGGPDWAAIGREIAALRPALLVVGAPYNADGSPGALTGAASAFAAELASRFGLPVQRVDERFSSLEASETLRAQRASGARRRRVRAGDVDSAAAAIILERWLGGEGFGQ
jgi:putative holliday junction resolvase